MHLSNQANLLTLLSFSAWFFFFYWYHGVGITLGYHRLLTHKSLKLPQWVTYFFVSGGYLCLMGAPITWVAVHRLHHQKSDQPGDPHSPLDGFYHSLVIWMTEMNRYQSNEEIPRQASDIIDDPVLRLLGYRHDAQQALLCLTVNVVFRVILFCVLGWVALLANVLAAMIVFVSTQLVNAVCHLQGVGYRTWETRDQSRNVWFVGVLALGEGWHNNHHGVPKSARHGMSWWEMDVTWYTVWVLEKLKLASMVIRPPKLPKQGAKAALESLLHLDLPKEVPAEPF